MIDKATGSVELAPPERYHLESVKINESAKKNLFI